MNPLSSNIRIILFVFLFSTHCHFLFLALWHPCCFSGTFHHRLCSLDVFLWAFLFIPFSVQFKKKISWRAYVLLYCCFISTSLSLSYSRSRFLSRVTLYYWSISRTRTNLLTSVFFSSCCCRSCSCCCRIGGGERLIHFPRILIPRKLNATLVWSA